MWAALIAMLSRLAIGAAALIGDWWFPGGCRETVHTATNRTIAPQIGFA